jgi:hypothetical protein
MTVVADTRKGLLPKIQAPPEWGIEPVPKEHRILGGLDYLVLWGNLGIGLLVMLAGTFIVPGLGLSDALAAILIGSILGGFMLGLVGIVGSDNAIPTMVLLRPVLGVRGSYLPSALNILQLIGWTIFEFIMMGIAADALSKTSLAFQAYPLDRDLCRDRHSYGVGGPISVVRQWLENSRCGSLLQLAHGSPFSWSRRTISPRY